MKVREEITRTVVSKIPSRLGDRIIQRDSIARDGTIVHREVIMYVPKD